MGLGSSIHVGCETVCNLFSLGGLTTIGKQVRSNHLLPLGYEALLMFNLKYVKRL